MTTLNIKPIEPPAELVEIISIIKNAGGNPLLVGGAVRDHLLGIAPKDFDVEVYGISLDQVGAALTSAGFSTNFAGKSFGVLKVASKIGGLSYDVSLPRTEKKIGEKHKDFQVLPDFTLPVKVAAARRDFTINAIAYDPFTKEFLDYYGGMNDLEDGILRHIVADGKTQFAEDALRVLRGCGFAGRFGFEFALETIDLCKEVAPEIALLSVERLWEEWKKILLRSPKPSDALSALWNTGAIEHFPELKALACVPEHPEWHPEDWFSWDDTGMDEVQKIELYTKAATALGQKIEIGTDCKNLPTEMWEPISINQRGDLLIITVDGKTVYTGGVWIHNCCVVDGAVRVLKDDEITDENEKLIVMLGALCHDLGKPITTKYFDGRWRAHAHSEAGEKPTISFLQRIGCPPAIVEAVVPLVHKHLVPAHAYRDKAEPKTIRRLATKVPLKTLLRIARADYLGSGLGKQDVDSRTVDFAVWMLERAEEIKVADSAPKPLLLGRHLLELGMKPGPEMGKICKAAFEAQLDGVFSDEDGAVEWAKNQLSP